MQIASETIAVRADLTEDGILLVRISNPPVNALSVKVRQGIKDALSSAQDDPRVLAVVLLGDNGNFIAGADIREFGLPPQSPSLPEVTNEIEASSKPVVAVIQGAALGGGLEVAMSAHFRVVLPKARLGLPEVTLGLLPGAGGTQRAPRLMGMRAAAELMLTGRHLSAEDAALQGVADSFVLESDPLLVGLAFAREVIALGKPIVRTRDRSVPNKESALEELEDVARAHSKKASGLFSPSRIVECLRASVELPFDEALALERKQFLACLSSSQRAGLVHAFLAEREVVKVPEIEGASVRSYQRIAVIGGGTMGAGIAVSVLDSGLPVMMLERDEASIARGRANVEKVYDALVSKGRISRDERAAKLSNFSTSIDFNDLADIDLVIEAVFEDLEVKKSVFREFDRVCKPGAVLATNTSYLNIDLIASATSRPQDVIGLHFFSPANIMKLMEIVVPSATSADVVATAFSLAKKLKKIPVRAGICDGFIGNRILAAYKQAADYLMEDGASPYEIDEAVRAFGFPMGPFQVTDLAGGDISWAARKRRAPTRDKRLRYVEIADRICENGWFGQKTGRGFYLYPNGARIGAADPEVMQIVNTERAKKGIRPRGFSSEEIMRRYVAAMVNEGAKILEEGIALRPLDIDVVFLHGYGFPRFRGGPMKYADMVGLKTVLADLKEFQKDDEFFWKPAQLIETLVDEARDFESLNGRR